MTQQRQSWWRNGVAADHIPIGVRGGSRPFHHHRRSKATRGCSILNIFWVFLLCLFLLVATFFYVLLQSKGIDIDEDGEEDRSQDDGSMASDYVMNATRLKGLEFGAGSVHYGQDSRYWDKDDRRRDEDYDEELLKARIDAKSKALKDLSASETTHQVLDHRGNGFSEMARYEKKQDKTEDALPIAKTVKFQDDDDRKGNEQLGNNGKGKIKEVEDDEHDDGVNMEDDDYVDSRHDHKDQSHANKQPSLQIRESSHQHEGKRKNLGIHMTSVKQSNLKKKPKPRKLRGACDMKISNSSALIVEPLESQKFARFTLLYTEQEEKPIGDQKWEPRFAGHQTLKEREESFTAHDQKINCGFVKGPKGSKSTGFDLEEDDMNYISSCHIAVMSCIFGNSDRLRSPLGRKVSRLSRKNICFVMFVDEETMQTLSAEGQQPDTMGFVGLWKIVVVKNLPYADMRRVGKIPKFLPHRLFPSARYSIWLDSKLRLQLDPMLILEYFLWRKGYEYAISNHYDRHCLWEEVAQNKRLNKYNHSIIDEQFVFYQADGMKRFNASDPDKLLPSNVPEGSFIVRAHTPMSNLFSCLWFNEVDRFTPRDQLSFAYTYHKLRRKNPEKPFFLNMFKDCERRKIAKLYHHRSEERRTIPASTI